MFPFKFRVSDLSQLVRSGGGGGGGVGWETRVEAVVGDAYQDSTHTAYALTRVFSPNIHLEFLGGSPQVLRPAMPFKFYVSIVVCSDWVRNKSGFASYIMLV